MTVAKYRGILFRKGTVVLTRDADAMRHKRLPEKPEARGKVVDHYRDMTGDRSPPYFVQFENGDSAWYDADEVVRPRPVSGG